jgi:hypothetical protein
MRASRLVPLAGLATVVLVVLTFIIGGETPNGDDPVTKVVSFYRDNDTDQMVAAGLLIWGMAAFLLFSSGLWRLLRNAETDRRGTSSLLVVGAALLAVGATIFAGLGFTLGDFADDLPPQAIMALNALNSDMFPTLTLGVFAFLIGAGASMIKTGALPKWLGWVAVVLAIAALTPVGFFAFLALGLWILIASALIFRAGDAPAERAA